MSVARIHLCSFPLYFTWQKSMSHFLHEGEHKPQQNFSYGHGNRAVHFKTRGIQQQQEFDDDSIVLQNFSNSNFDGTNSSSSKHSTNTLNNNSSSRRVIASAFDGGISTKTATILVSKSKTKTGLPLTMK